ncbi:MAG: DUF1350 family protein [Leptolyngbyaceae cyanobacterium SM1_1_3]|nr:DUF1350 family protein [Leptolyngbyaceae cyanobacterium SM1_1_3]NJN04639.1 DUF1350 family protein [Leptolyngbyaceae cyanobacterium RM1_1_2]NJO09185.1 DUF1350 family protein [Leptolyngbyaceae cyanobacterium SL_1_1]
MNWQEVAGNWILVPPNPRALIHFLGGAFVAAAPHLTYRWLLENLGRQGYVIIATPFVNTFDHKAIAQEVLTTFDQGLHYLHKRVLSQRYWPIYGLGHSMGCKVHLLINSLYNVERSGNILVSFNNYPARRSVPLLEQMISFAPTFNFEFIPSPEETLQLADQRYGVRRNLLIKFRRDDIDQTRSLSDVLVRRFPELTTVKILPGTHTTPIAQDVAWEPGADFSPLDAIGQFMKQEFYRDLNGLQQTMVQWLNPLETV